MMLRAVPIMALGLSTMTCLFLQTLEIGPLVWLGKFSSGCQLGVTIRLLWIARLVIAMFALNAAVSAQSFLAMIESAKYARPSLGNLVIFIQTIEIQLLSPLNFDMPSRENSFLSSFQFLPSPYNVLYSWSVLLAFPQVEPEPLIITPEPALHCHAPT